MKSFFVAMVLMIFFVSCDNRTNETPENKQDTLDIVPGYGGGHEPGTGGTNSPSYPKQVMPEQPDTAPPRGMHGVNVDTSAASN